MLGVHSGSHGLLLPVHSPSTEENMFTTIPGTHGFALPKQSTGNSQTEPSLEWLVHGPSSKERVSATVLKGNVTVSTQGGSNSNRHKYDTFSPMGSHLHDDGRMSLGRGTDSTARGQGTLSPITSSSSEEEELATMPSPEAANFSSLAEPDTRLPVHSSPSEMDMSCTRTSPLRVNCSPPRLNRSPPELNLALRPKHCRSAAERRPSETTLATRGKLVSNANDVPKDHSPSKTHPNSQKRVAFNENPVSEEHLFSESSPVTQHDKSSKAGSEATDRSCESPQKVTTPSDSVPALGEEELYSEKAWRVYQDVLSSRGAPHGDPADFVAQYPSLDMERLEELSELATTPSNDLSTYKIFIDNSTAATTLLVQDIEASWQFYQQVLPQVSFKIGAAGSFSMLFPKDTGGKATERSDLEFIEIRVKASPDEGKARPRHVRPEDAPIDIAVKLVCRDTLAFGTNCPFLYYSDPVFPVITRITKELLRLPEWRADRSMEMESRDISWPGGRRLDFTDLDGYGWRLVEVKKKMHT